MIKYLKIRSSWMRVERSLGLIGRAEASVDRSAAAVARSRRQFVDPDPKRQARLFGERLKRCAPASTPAPVTAGPGEVF